MLAPIPEKAVAPPRRLQFGDCVLDLAAQKLLRAGAAVPLPPRYYAVLAHLAGSGGRLVEKDELLDAVWGHRSVSDSALKVAINAVRAALGDSSKTPRHIETVSRRGYRFVAAVTEHTEASEPAPPPPARGNLPAPQPGLIGREADLLRVQAALAAQRLVTLHGPGGVGKTRLARPRRVRTRRPTASGCCGWKPWPTPRPCWRPWPARWVWGRAPTRARWRWRGPCRGCGCASSSTTPSTCCPPSASWPPRC